MNPTRCTRVLLALPLLFATPASSQCLADGQYLSTPTISKSCCLGIVVFSVQRWDIVITGNQIRVYPFPPSSLPPFLTGTIDCQAGTFTASASIPGGCTETYTLQGQYESIASWTGTFTAQYVGANCGCFGQDPCMNQQFAVSGAIQATDVGPGAAAPGLARLDIGPNPFSASTTIRVRIERSEAASLAILDVAGRTVATVRDDAPLERGDHEFSWARRTDDGRRAPTGIYFVRLRTVSTERVAKVLVLD